MFLQYSPFNAGQKFTEHPITYRKTNKNEVSTYFYSEPYAINKIKEQQDTLLTAKCVPVHYINNVTCFPSSIRERERERERERGGQLARKELRNTADSCFLNSKGKAGEKRRKKIKKKEI